MEHFRSGVTSLSLWHLHTHTHTHTHTLQDITDSALYILSEVYKEKSSMARSLVRIFFKLGSVSEKESEKERGKGGGRVYTVKESHGLTEYEVIWQLFLSPLSPTYLALSPAKPRID